MDIKEFLKLSYQVNILKKRRDPTISSDTLIHFKRIFVSSVYKKPHPNLSGYYHTRIILMRDSHPYQWMHYDYWPAEVQRQLLVFDSNKNGWLHTGPWQQEFDELLQFLHKEIEDFEVAQKTYHEKQKILRERDVQKLRDSYKTNLCCRTTPAPD